VLVLEILPYVFLRNEKWCRDPSSSISFSSTPSKYERECLFESQSGSFTFYTRWWTIDLFIPKLPYNVVLIGFDFDQLNEDCFESGGIVTYRVDDNLHICVHCLPPSLYLAIQRIY
jgi:hypothetical protein